MSEIVAERRRDLSPNERARLLTPYQIGERLMLGRSQVFKLLAAGEIRSVKIGKLRRIPEDAVRAYIDRLTAEQNRAG